MTNINLNNRQLSMLVFESLAGKLLSEQFRFGKLGMTKEEAIEAIQKATREHFKNQSKDNVEFAEHEYYIIGDALGVDMYGEDSPTHYKHYDALVAAARNELLRIGGSYDTDDVLTKKKNDEKITSMLKDGNN